jgi:hypothetical protein
VPAGDPHATRPAATALSVSRACAPGSCARGSSDADSRWVASEPVEVPAGGLRAGIEIRLVALEREDTIEGVVLIARRRAGSERGRALQRTQRGGHVVGQLRRRRRRTFPPPRADARAARAARARPGNRAGPTRRRTESSRGRRDVVLQFPPQRWLEVAVHARGGSAIDEFAATVMSADRTRTLAVGKLEVHAGGRARLLVPGEPFLVEVRARGHGGAELGPWDPAQAPALAEASLEPPRPALRGRVMWGEEPVANARVGLYELTAETTRVESNGFLTRLNPRAEDETTSDAQGWFELDPSRPERDGQRRFFQRDPSARATFAIPRRSRRPRARRRCRRSTSDPAVGADGIVVALAHGGAIEGRVRTAPGRDPAGTVVAVESRRRQAAHAAHGTGRNVPLREPDARPLERVACRAGGASGLVVDLVEHGSQDAHGVPLELHRRGRRDDALRPRP